MECHHRNYRQVQRSHRNKRTTAELTTVRSGEWSVNTDKSGHGRRDCEHLESSLAAQLVQEKFHATRLLLQHERPRMKKQTAFTAVEETRIFFVKYLGMAYGGGKQEATSACFSTILYENPDQRAH